MAKRLNWRNLGKSTVVQLLDSHAPDGRGFAETYRELIDRVEVESPREVVLDFASVRKVSAAGIRRLLVLKEKVVARGGALTLRNVGDQVRQVFTLTKIAHCFGLPHTPQGHRSY